MTFEEYLREAEKKIVKVLLNSDYEKTYQVYAKEVEMYIHQYGINNLSDEQNEEMFRIVLGFVEKNKGYLGGGYGPVNQTKPRLEETKSHLIIHPKKDKGKYCLPKYDEGDNDGI